MHFSRECDVSFSVNSLFSPNHRQASKRLESGEISQEDFLNMAHKIKHLFQYQEEKQQHSENWDETGGFPKKQLLNTTQANQPHAHGSMDPAELSYYEHKSKLRKTQVNRRADGEEGQAEAGEAAQDEKSHGHTPPSKYSRPPRDALGEPGHFELAPDVCLVTTKYFFEAPQYLVLS